MKQARRNGKKPGKTYPAEGPNTEKGRTSMSSHDMMNPYGGMPMRRVIEPFNPNERLLERILSNENIGMAWKRVKANHGAPGVDGISIEQFPDHTRPLWVGIRESLLAGRYQPLPVRRVEIPKATGGTRPLGIPTVLDRLIQQAIAQILSPIFDPTFSNSSFGFRPGRSAHHAVQKAREYIREGYRIAVDVDLSKFFDTVDHDVLMHRVARKVLDKRVLRLIGKYLRADVMVHGRLQETSLGVPQGGPLSPLLANVILDDLDKELEKRGHRFTRYADDFIILVKSREAGERVLGSLKRFLENSLKLRINQEKSRVVPTNQATFLGFTFRGTKIRWTEKAFREFKRKVKELTGRSWFVSMEYRYKKLAEYLRGWMNYFGISEYYIPIPEIDHWLRRRLRMCYFKQWRRAKTKVRELRKLGTSLHAAISVAISRKGPWRLSRTLATQMGMTNKWLKEQGLLSVKDLWVNIHYPATAR
jgi:RNA-directed DNA polymerase